VLRVALGSSFLGGQVTTIVLLLILSSFQLFFLFIMGQYVARIYDETRDRPLYIVASTNGFDARPESEPETQAPQPEPEP
jgi:dolichol-phosphate mannosyltransferase